jgi:hypothetical protein
MHWVLGEPMRTRTARMRRVLDRSAPARAARRGTSAKVDLARQVRSTLIDFTALGLPADVTDALADAFWHHFGVRDTRSVLVLWAHMKVFGQFAHDTAALSSIADIHRGLLARYVEWLSARRRAAGKPWSKSTCSSAYTALRKLLQWLERCRPGVLTPMEYPYNPFPWRNRDATRVGKLPAVQLRAILKACEREITAIRARRASFAVERAAHGEPDKSPDASRVALVAAIEQRYAGTIPTWIGLRRAGDLDMLRGLKKFGGSKQIAPLLYPDARSLLPYYLAILIHSAGNPEPIAALTSDCLQPIPLLDDRQMLVWAKHRAGQIQRRSFRSNDPDEPPALVREILAYTEPLRSRAPPALRRRLFLFHGVCGISGLSAGFVKTMIRTEFAARHGLPHFSLASIRPSVLSAFYRASGDLMKVKTVANHRSIATTIRYVDTPQVQAEHRARVAALQSTFLGHIEQPTSPTQRTPRASPRPPRSGGAAVSMFGFDCKDPFAGIAPGSRRGSLCTHFLGCFTCPNAIIADDPRTLARLQQARQHLRAAAATIHPARWQAIYAPSLQILENDILPRFGAAEFAAAQALRATLPPLPDLR